jgi:hypothetical protein
MKRTKKLRK